MVYWAGALDLMTDADCAYLAEERGIATVLDLRHADELAIRPSSMRCRTRVAPLSLFPDAVNQQGLIEELNGLYGTGPSPQRYLHYLTIGGPQFAEAFDCWRRRSRTRCSCTARRGRTAPACWWGC
jgi:hypothetical protein